MPDLADAQSFRARAARFSSDRDHRSHSPVRNGRRTTTKYRYDFWKPVTAIRNGDIHANPDTERDPTWQPLDATPMHPEYPCAHCILSGAAAALIESSGGLGELTEFRLTSPTAPGVTHHWANLESFTGEVANARIWAGFHYRSSARVGTTMGREAGRYVAQHFAAAKGAALPLVKCSAGRCCTDAGPTWMRAITPKLPVATGSIGSATRS